MATDSGRMESDRDERAERDAFHFVETAYDAADADRFFAVGEWKAES